MKRLTTDNPKDNIENALNLFYVKDQWTWVRGGGPAPDYADISLCDFVRVLVQANIPDAELPEDDDNLSDLMCEWLMDEPDTAEGIISLLYTAGWAFAELRHRLAAYEGTGLEPEEIVKMGMMFEDSKRYSGRLEGKLKAYEAIGSAEKLQEIKNEAYDLGYQSCLNYKGLKWSEAEELQRYRERDNGVHEDSVLVIRCQNCKYRHSSEFCECRPADGYCNDGERSEESVC